MHNIKPENLMITIESAKKMRDIYEQSKQELNAKLQNLPIDEEVKEKIINVIDSKIKFFDNEIASKQNRLAEIISNDIK